MTNRPTKPNDKSNVDEAIERGKALIEQGNQRRLVIRTAEGQSLLDVSLTVAVIAGVILLLLPSGLFFVLLGVVVAIFTKLQVEVLREITDDEKTISVDPEDKA